MGPADYRDGLTLQRRRRKEPLLLPSTIWNTSRLPFLPENVSILLPKAKSSGKDLRRKINLSY
jgi:hypothetical protein